MRSWLQFNDVELVRKIKIGNTNQTLTIEDERMPIKDELRQILSYAQERGRCSISFMVFGLKPQALGNSTGTIGQDLRDLPELEIHGNEVDFIKIPRIVVVRLEISKAKNKYLSFLGP